MNTTTMLNGRSATISNLPGGNLTEASRQWAERPDDERFASVHDFASWAQRKQESSAETDPIDARKLRFEADRGEVQIVGPSGHAARLTSHAFEQECRALSAPADFLRGIDATTVASVLNQQRAKSSDGRSRVLLMNRGAGGDLLVRGATSERYARIWDTEVTDFVQRLADLGWVVPPARPARPGQRGTRPATREDLSALDKIGAGGGQKVCVGDPIAPAGLYGSMHDSFAFLIDPTTPIDDGKGGVLWRGIWIRNSEVGGISLELTAFAFDGVCGNHIVWGADEVVRLTVRHVGSASDRFATAKNALRAWAKSDTSMEKNLLAMSTAHVLGESKEDVAKIVSKAVVIPQSTVLDAIECAEQNPWDLRGSSPLSAWGLSAGMTRLSQRQAHADSRAKIDRAAGKVLRMAF